MPKGTVHTVINLSTFGLLSVAATQLLPAGQLAPMVPLLIGGVIGTVLVTPDLDMKGVRVNAQRAWGPLGFIWQPLINVSKHRGVSHTYLRGPLIRAVYLTAVLALLLLLGDLIAGTLTHTALPELLTRQRAFVTGLFDKKRTDLPGLILLAWIYLGYWSAQVLHLAADKVPLRLRTL